jgi:hypothetical protein
MPMPAFIPNFIPYRATDYKVDIFEMSGHDQAKRIVLTCLHQWDKTPTPQIAAWLNMALQCVIKGQASPYDFARWEAEGRKLATETA